MVKNPLGNLKMWLFFFFHEWLFQAKVNVDWHFILSSTHTKRFARTMQRWIGVFLHFFFVLFSIECRTQCARTILQNNCIYIIALNVYYYFERSNGKSILAWRLRKAQIVILVLWLQLPKIKCIGQCMCRVFFGLFFVSFSISRLSVKLLLLLVFFFARVFLCFDKNKHILN